MSAADADGPLFRLVTEGGASAALLRVAESADRAAAASRRLEAAVSDLRAAKDQLRRHFGGDRPE